MEEDFLAYQFLKWQNGTLRFKTNDKEIIRLKFSFQYQNYPLIFNRCTA